MKKLFLSLALVCGMAAVANAQWWVGGTASVWVEDEEGMKTATSYRLMPEVGYSFNDTWGLGVSFGYVHEELGFEDFKAKSDGFKINPFARYTYLTGRAGSLFVDGGVGYAYTKYKGADDKQHEVQVGLRPGFSLNVTNNFAVIGKFGFLGWEYAKFGGDKVNSYGLDLDMDNVEIGVVYKF